MIAPTARAEKDQSIVLQIPSRLGWERVAMDAAASVATLMGFRLERIDDIKTVVSEAVANAIEHGNALDASQTVSILLVPAQDLLEISVYDHALSPLQRRAIPVEKPSLEDKLAGRDGSRGWGVFLIRALVDEVEFAHTRRGNHVRMVIHRDPRQV